MVVILPELCGDLGLIDWTKANKIIEHNNQLLFFK